MSSPPSRTVNFHRLIRRKKKWSIRFFCRTLRVKLVDLLKNRGRPPRKHKVRFGWFGSGTLLWSGINWARNGAEVHKRWGCQDQILHTLCLMYDVQAKFYLTNISRNNTFPVPIYLINTGLCVYEYFSKLTPTNLTIYIYIYIYILWKNKEKPTYGQFHYKHIAKTIIFASWGSHVFYSSFLWLRKTILTNQLRDFSPRENYTERATAACRQS
jgi:hypothetical protein